MAKPSTRRSPLSPTAQAVASILSTLQEQEQDAEAIIAARQHERDQAEEREAAEQWRKRQERIEQDAAQAAEVARQQGIAAGITDEDELARRAAQAAEQVRIAAHFPMAASPTVTPSVLTPQERRAFMKLRLRKERLTELHGWLEQDPELLQLIDSSINQRVQAAQQKQALISIGVGILSLVAGWLLSAISPALAFAHLLGR